MSRRPIAWVVFLGFVTLLAVGGVLGNRAVQLEFRDFISSWQSGSGGHTLTPAYLRIGDAANLLPQPLRAGCSTRDD